MVDSVRTDIQQPPGFSRLSELSGSATNCRTVESQCAVRAVKNVTGRDELPLIRL
jgi:hypothetical protein